MSSYQFIQIRPPFDIRVNFWEENFQVSLIDPFKSLYQRDTTKDHLKSSYEMWCIWLNSDPNYENKIYRLPLREKESAIKEYYPEFDFNDPLIATCITQYKNFCLSPAAKGFAKEEESLVSRSEFIANAKYTFDEMAKDKHGNPMFTKQGSPIIIRGTAKDLDMMRKSTTDILERYERVKKVFEEEQRMVRLHGGGRESHSESSSLVLIKDDDDLDEVTFEEHTSSKEYLTTQNTENDIEEEEPITNELFNESLEESSFEEDTPEDSQAQEEIKEEIKEELDITINIEDFGTKGYPKESEFKEPIRIADKLKKNGRN